VIRETIITKSTELPEADFPRIEEISSVQSNQELPQFELEKSIGMIVDKSIDNLID